ncbi:hypothetical protein [Methylotenera sp. G11]|uniref:hypothetical protein n=1 Tax=Methylotenera sp. G11 TaxID=1506585 RepID=UPI0006468A29|nr:hypothetical protein [Methylotenera sp. G11]
MRLHILFIAAIFSAGVSNAADSSEQNAIRGADLNNNGIRDDIDAYIAKQSYSTAQLAAVTRHARWIQSAVIFTPGSREDARIIALEDGKAIDCIYEKFQSPDSPDNAAAVAIKIESLTVNTPARKKSYQKFNELISGMAFQLQQGNTCE